MSRPKAARCAALICSMLGSVAALSQAATVSNAPTVLSRAVDQGPVEHSSRIDFTVWLNLRDDAGLESAAQAAREGSGVWLNQEQIDARHSPAAASVATVTAYLKAHGFSVGEVGAGNLYVKASGTAEAVQRVFGVELHHYNLNGRSFRANTAAARIPQELKPLVASVGGLNTLGATPNVVRAPHPARAGALHPADAEGLRGRIIKFGAKSDGLVFSPQCFNGVATESFSGGGATASYTGTRYGTDINNSTPGTVSPCGYQPSDLATAYNLNPLYRAGLDGSGTTVAITDAYGSITVAADLATFSQAMGLPPANLTIIGTPTESGYSGTPNSGWADETTLDVEWVHAVAPGAKILLVIAPTNNDSDLFAAIATAAATPGVVAISNSWSENESGTDISSRAAADGVIKLANARGVAVNFATGDSGNETINLGYADVNYPASSPYATGIGGVSVVLDSRQRIKLQTSWGNNLTEIADKISLGSPPLDPPFNEGFVFGGGGGVSNVYPAPSFQRSLPGHRRLVPDISWVGDPYTGVEIIETEDAAGDQGIAVIGGTSLATPMFSGLWGIATQAAHHKLGQAAPYLYSLPRGAITDVGAANSPDNVTGVITDSNGTQQYSASELASPLQGQDTFVSALYNSPYSTRWFVLTFGTDSGLEAGPGFDQATGLGTPNGWEFVRAFSHRD